MSKTKHLAKKLGIISKDKLKDEFRTAAKSQPFSYICVIDFESTCWNERRLHRTQEIIEFPAVLLSISTGAVEGEFQHYIQPQENTTLSAFCAQLTGISQAQVDNGIPLPVCLRLFDEWVTIVEKEKDIQFLRPPPTSNNKHLLKQESAAKKLVAIATWTDWDLGVALHYECQRKRIRKAPYFNQWIDLKGTYKAFYDCKPAGLSGALSDLGLSFVGREHSGIDDARNTARLCWRMVCDGCILRITKSLSKDKKELAHKNAPVVDSCLSSSTVSSGEVQSICNSADRVSSRFLPHAVIKLGCVDGRQLNGEEDTDVSLTSAEDCQFLSSIAGQVDDGEPSHINATTDCSSTVENFKKPHSIPCKRPPSLSSPRVPLYPKAVNVAPPSTFSTQPQLMVGPPFQSPTGSVTGSEYRDVLPLEVAPRMNVQARPPSGPLHTAMQCTTSPSPTTLSSTSACTVTMSPEGCGVTSPTIPDEHLPLPLRVTPPLCRCGRRAQECSTSAPGPNEGRSYFTCSKRKARCGFFQWKSTVLSDVPHGSMPSSTLYLTTNS